MGQHQSSSTDKGQNQDFPSADSSKKPSFPPYSEVPEDQKTLDHVMEDRIAVMTQELVLTIQNHLATEPLYGSKFTTNHDTGINRWACEYCYDSTRKTKAPLGYTPTCPICQHPMVTARHPEFLYPEDQKLERKYTYHYKPRTWFCVKEPELCENAKEKRTWVSKCGRRCSECGDSMRYEGWEEDAAKKHRPGERNMWNGEEY
ncbi:hypothetical protein HYFRA_00013715 [Hymenoscyphus fraxineus]|uniref:Uncharacterized protein n=1 Tax=Hymenoscyphus fraxineus TaxID=746836 RepID=A0A9N9L7M8_9HELO|nr:hypothetical protein HYFRA_00013715 [Hymenoscyphus fraxineus]